MYLPTGYHSLMSSGYYIIQWQLYCDLLNLFRLLWYPCNHFCTHLGCPARIKFHACVDIQSNNPDGYIYVYHPNILVTLEIHAPYVDTHLLCYLRVLGIYLHPIMLPKIPGASSSHPSSLSALYQWWGALYEMCGRKWTTKCRTKYLRSYNIHKLIHPLEGNILSPIIVALMTCCADVPWNPD